MDLFQSHLFLKTCLKKRTPVHSEYLPLETIENVLFAFLEILINTHMVFVLFKVGLYCSFGLNLRAVQKWVFSLPTSARKVFVCLIVWVFFNFEAFKHSLDFS